MCGGVKIVASRLSWCVFSDLSVHIFHWFFYHRCKFLITVMFHFYKDWARDSLILLWLSMCVWFHNYFFVGIYRLTPLFFVLHALWRHFDNYMQVLLLLFIYWRNFFQENYFLYSFVMNILKNSHHNLLSSSDNHWATSFHQKSNIDYLSQNGQRQAL